MDFLPLAVIPAVVAYVGRSSVQRVLVIGKGHDWSVCPIGARFGTWLDWFEALPDRTLPVRDADSQIGSMPPPPRGE